MSLAKDTSFQMSCQAVSWIPWFSYRSSVSKPAWPPGSPFLCQQLLLTWCPPWCCGWECSPGARGAGDGTAIVIVQGDPSPVPILAVHGLAGEKAAAQPGSVWLCLQWSVLRKAKARAPSPTCGSSQLCQLSSRRLSSLDTAAFRFSLLFLIPVTLPEGAVGPCCCHPVPMPVSQHPLYKQGLRAVSALEA